MRLRFSGDLGGIIEDADKANTRYAEKIADATARLRAERDAALDGLAMSAERAGQRAAEAIRAKKGGA